MITKLIVKRFRGFEQFEMIGLGRINLLVGTNNCGKTSILEAVRLAASIDDALSFQQVARQRGEKIYEKTSSSRVISFEADITHLFYGHTLTLGNNFEIKTFSESDCETLHVTVIEKNLNDFNENNITSDDENLSEESNWVLNCSWSTSTNTIELPLSLHGGISNDAIRRFSRLRINKNNPVRTISTSGLNANEIISMFEDIVLTREEDLVTQALRIVEPSIERIATISSDQRLISPDNRGGIVVKCEGSSQRIPIGNLGDGIWRILGLALALVSAENGILLIDEIDTGLHFTVLEKMWKLVKETSQRLNVQVFATTHSRDAYESLASIARPTVTTDSTVTIQRIDKSRSTSIAFTEQEIIASAEYGTEVR